MVRSMCLRGFARIGDAPDRAVGIFGDEERAVIVDGDPDRLGGVRIGSRHYRNKWGPRSLVKPERKPRQRSFNAPSL
jgi:hypothetical protein